MQLKTQYLYKTVILHGKNQSITATTSGVTISPPPLLDLPRHLTWAILQVTEHSAAVSEKLKTTFYFMEVILGPQQSSCHGNIQFCRAVRKE